MTGLEKLIVEQKPLCYFCLDILKSRIYDNLVGDETGAESLLAIRMFFKIGPDYEYQDVD